MSKDWPVSPDKNCKDQYEELDNWRVIFQYSREKAVGRAIKVVKIPV